MTDTTIKYLGLALGWGFIALGVLLIARALFAVRFRGRRRCPRCWYSMDGVPSLQCPECGRAAKRESRLFKTRRRYRRAAAASCVLIFGLAALYASGAIRFGWARALPSTALVALAPIDLSVWNNSASSGGSSPRFYTPAGNLRGGPVSPTANADWKDQLSEELVRRVKSGELRDWQARLLARRIALAGRAAGSEPTVFDVPAIMSDAWLDSLRPRDFAPNLDVSSLSSFSSGLLEPADSRNDAGVRLIIRLLYEVHGICPGTPVGPVILWWNKESADTVATLLSAIELASPGHPASIEPDGLVRVYDVRQVLVKRLRDLPQGTLATESDALFTEIIFAVGYEGVHAEAPLIFHGRLIVAGSDNYHRAVEAHVNACERNSTGRIFKE